jgi:single-strand DNA-binding protein
VIFNERLAEIAEKYLKKGSKGLSRGRIADPQMDGSGRPGASYDRDRAEPLPRRADDAGWAGGARGAGGPPMEGGYDEGFAGGGFDDERPTSGSAPSARARTPVNDLDDDIPF